MNWVEAKWKSLKDDPFWGIVIVIMLVVITLGEAFGGMHHFRDAIAFLISKAVAFDASTGKPVVGNLFGWLAVFAVSVAVIFVLAAERIRDERDGLRKDVQRIRSEVLGDQAVIEKTFDRTMSAAAKICSQLFPRDARPQKNILAAHALFLVDETFSATVTSEWEYKAIDDLYFEQFTIGSESDGDPCKYLDDIKFKIRDANPLNSIAYLQTENSAYSKRVVGFFLPHIKSTEPVARTICLSYCWPGMMKRLKNRGSETGSSLLLSRDPVPIAETLVYFAPAIKDRIEAKISGTRLGKDNETCERAVCDIPGYEGWIGWRYTLTNAPPGEYKLEFTYKR